jgi:hypothetical protein
MPYSTKQMLIKMEADKSSAQKTTAKNTIPSDPLTLPKPLADFSPMSQSENLMKNLLEICLTPTKDKPKLTPNS